MIFLIALMSIIMDSACAIKNGADDYIKNHRNIMQATYDNIDIPSNFNQAVAWYRTLAEQGNDTAQFWLGDLYFYGLGGTGVNYRQAKMWYKLAARQGNAAAQLQLDYIRSLQNN